MALKRGGFYATAALALGMGISAQAQAQGSFWDSLDAVQVTPYVWASGLKGEVSPFKRVPSIPVEKKFSDVWDDLQGGFFLHTWLRKDRYVLFSDLLYVSTRDSRQTEHAPLLGTASGRLDSKQLTFALQPGYRLYSRPDFTLDFLAGVRFWHVSNRLEFNGGPYKGKHTESMNWVDPEISLRMFGKLNDHWSGLLLLGVGGFDMGAKSSQQVLASVNYKVADHWTVSAGYRYQAVNYQRRGHVFDTSMSGPVLGVTWQF